MTKLCWAAPSFGRMNVTVPALDRQLRRIEVNVVRDDGHFLRAASGFVGCLSGRLAGVSAGGFSWRSSRLGAFFRSRAQDRRVDRTGDARDGRMRFIVLGRATRRENDQDDNGNTRLSRKTASPSTLALPIRTPFSGDSSQCRLRAEPLLARTPQDSAGRQIVPRAL